MGEELTIKGTQAKVKVRSPIWVHRTRRDEFGNSDRTNSGRRFKYTQWFVSSWIPKKSMNKYDPNPANHFEEDLICVEEYNAPEHAMSRRACATRHQRAKFSLNP